MSWILDSQGAALAREQLEVLKRQHVLVSARRIQRETVVLPSGIAELDRLTGGGVPRGELTEVVAPGSGGAGVLYSLLAAASKRGERMAVVDPSAALDVPSAQAAGVALERLLWIRPDGSRQGLRVMEWILETGSFAVVVLDLGICRPQRSLALPSACWVRIRKRAAAARAAAIVLSAEGLLGSFASLSLEVSRRSALWKGKGDDWLDGVGIGFELRRRRQGLGVGEGLTRDRRTG